MTPRPPALARASSFPVPQDHRSPAHCHRPRGRVFHGRRDRPRSSTSFCRRELCSGRRLCPTRGDIHSRGRPRWERGPCRSSSVMRVPRKHACLCQALGRAGRQPGSRGCTARPVKGAGARRETGGASACGAPLGPGPSAETTSFGGARGPHIRVIGKKSAGTSTLRGALEGERRRRRGRKRSAAERTAGCPLARSCASWGPTDAEGQAHGAP